MGRELFTYHSSPIPGAAPWSPEDPRQHSVSVDEQEVSHAPASPRYSGPATASASFTRSACATSPTTKTIWRDVRKDTTDMSATRPADVTCGSTSAGSASWALPSPAVTSNDTRVPP